MLKMKKKITLGIVFLLLISLCTTIVSFAGFTKQTKYEVHKNGVICSLKVYDENAKGKVQIPEEYEGKMVTGILEEAFINCPEVTEVVVPKTVVNIGERALGYVLSEDGEAVKKEGFVIWGRGNSEAQKYAKENGFTFKVLLTTPELVSAKNSADGVRVTWKPTENAAGYTGDKYELLKSQGFTHYLGFCTDGTPWFTATADYVRQGRILVSGANMAYHSDWFIGIFDPHSVLDTTRGIIPE